MKETMKKIRKFFRKTFTQKFFVKVIVLLSGLALIATSILPYLIK